MPTCGKPKGARHPDPLEKIDPTMAQVVCTGCYKSRAQMAAHNSAQQGLPAAPPPVPPENRCRAILHGPAMLQCPMSKNYPDPLDPKGPYRFCVEHATQAVAQARAAGKDVDAVAIKVSGLSAHRPKRARIFLSPFSKRLCVRRSTRCAPRSSTAATRACALRRYPTRPAG